MNVPVILAIDAGTSVNRAMLFDEKGTPLYESRNELDVEQPHPGWVEQDPETIWNATRRNIRNVVEYAEKKGYAIQVVGLTGHMHGTFLVDEKGNLARKKAIIWLDSRTSELLKKFDEDGTSDKVFKISGWRLITSQQFLHLRWLRENEPETLRRARYFIPCKDYVRFRLTGRILSDYTDASFTGLFNNIERKWSKELFELIDVPYEIAPSLLNSWEIGGEVTEEAAKETGLRPGTPVSVGCGDTAAMALGSNVTETNQLLVNVGAAGVYERPMEEPRYDWKHRCYQIACHAIPDRWLLQANQMSAGLTLKWFRANVMKTDEPYSKLDELASKSPPGAGGVIFHPYILGERSPFVDPYVRGLFLGLSLSSRLEDFLRAIYEGVAFAVRDNLDILLIDNSYSEMEVFMSGGGANSKLWAQIISDVLGTVVKIPRVKDVGALGAAILASLGVKIYRDYREALRNMITIESELPPRLELKEKYEKLFKIFKEVYGALKPYYKSLLEFSR